MFLVNGLTITSGKYPKRHDVQCVCHAF
ncbi:hypothetical protein MED222_05300 [Vibrio sp. MED222]|nr:hypothetical protein MED222_05300 [Vibrio sp. MED222]